MLSRLSQQLELRQHSLRLMEERVAGSEAAQLLEAVASCERQLAEAQAAVGAAQEKKKAMVAAAKVCVLVAVVVLWGGGAGGPRPDGRQCNLACLRCAPWCLPCLQMTPPARVPFWRGGRTQS